MEFFSSSVSSQDAFSGKMLEIMIGILGKVEIGGKEMVCVWQKRGVGYAGNRQAHLWSTVVTRDIWRTHLSPLLQRGVDNSATFCYRDMQPTHLSTRYSAAVQQMYSAAFVVASDHIHSLHWRGWRWKIETFILSEWLYCRAGLRGGEEVRKRFYAGRDEQKLESVEEKNPKIWMPGDGKRSI